MTIASLIEEVLAYIRRAFYAGRDREFARDRYALMKAIARYGYECERRAWHFSASDIQSDLHALLISVLKHRAEIKYLPAYLEGAVDRHVRMRAEELSAKATTIGRIVPAAIAGLQVKEVREPKPVEILAAVYRDLRNRRRRPTLKSEPEPSLL